MNEIAHRVAKRFRDQRGPSKDTMMDYIVDRIRSTTGIGRGVAEGIAKALVRSGRDIGQLAVMKGWPLNGETLVGPQGTIELSELRSLTVG